MTGCREALRDTIGYIEQIFHVHAVIKCTILLSAFNSIRTYLVLYQRNNTVPEIQRPSSFFPKQQNY